MEKVEPVKEEVEPVVAEEKKAPATVEKKIEPKPIKQAKKESNCFCM